MRDPGDELVGQAYGTPGQSYGAADEALEYAFRQGQQDSEPGSAPRQCFDNPRMQAAYNDGWRRVQEELA